MSNAWIDAQERGTVFPFRAGKDLPKDSRWGNHHRIVVSAGLTKLGNQRPYFSVTGEIVNKRKRNDPVEACGQLHEDIAQYWPELAPVIALHMSDDDGVPMQAAANGAYWLGLTQYKTAQVRPEHTNGGLVDAPLPYLPYVMRHFRISRSEARSLTTRLRSVDDLDAYVDSQRPRWKREADEAVALLARLREKSARF